MRKSHRQKVADRRKKRQRRGRQRFYDGLVAKFTRQLKEMQASPLAFAKMFSPPETIRGLRLRITDILGDNVLVEKPAVPSHEERERMLEYFKPFDTPPFEGRIFHDIVLSEAQSAHLLDQARRMDEAISLCIPGDDADRAGGTFISALVAHVRSNPAEFIRSFNALNPGLLDRVRPSLDLDDNTNPSAEPTKKVCPNCEGTGWAYHEPLPIERHVGCEDCGGCGDERGTGIIP